MKYWRKWPSSPVLKKRNQVHQVGCHLTPTLFIYYSMETEDSEGLRVVATEHDLFVVDGKIWG